MVPREICDTIPFFGGMPLPPLLPLHLCPLLPPRSPLTHYLYLASWHLSRALRWYETSSSSDGPPRSHLRLSPSRRGTSLRRPSESQQRMSFQRHGCLVLCDVIQARSTAGQLECCISRNMSCAPHWATCLLVLTYCPIKSEVRLSSLSLPLPFRFPFSFPFSPSWYNFTELLRIDMVTCGGQPDGYDFGLLASQTAPHD